MRILFVLYFFIVSCSDSSNILPSSTGKTSEVVFVVDDILWEHSYDTIVRSIFGAQIDGINKVEPIFKIIQINATEFKSFLKTHKNIVLFTEDTINFQGTNKWASNQFISHISLSNNFLQLRKELYSIRQSLKEREVNYIRKTLIKSSQKKIEKKLKTNFGVDIIVPKEYIIERVDTNLFLASYDPIKSEEIKKIIIFSFIPKSINIAQEVLTQSDSIFSVYLLGESKQSYVKIEPAYLPYYVDGFYRGLWRLHNGFMGGPFIIKTHLQNEKLIVSIGLVFAPHSKKRKYIKEFEAIL